MGQEESGATAVVAVNAFGAMMKVFLVSVIGTILIPPSLLLLTRSP